MIASSRLVLSPPPRHCGRGDDGLPGLTSPGPTTTATLPPPLRHTNSLPAQRALPAGASQGFRLSELLCGRCVAPVQLCSCCACPWPMSSADLAVTSSHPATWRLGSVNSGQNCSDRSCFRNQKAFGIKMERSDVLNVVEKFALSRKKNNLDNQTSNRIGIKMERFAVASKKKSDLYVHQRFGVLALSKKKTIWIGEQQKLLL